MIVRTSIRLDKDLLDRVDRYRRLIGYEKHGEILSRNQVVTYLLDIALSIIEGKLDEGVG